MKRTFPILLLLSLVVMSCADSQNNKNHLTEIAKLQVSIDSLKNALVQNKATEKNQIRTFLTF